MGEVGTYLSTLEGADRDALDRVYAIARGVVPEAEEGTSYGMPALLYRDKGLIATVRGKKFLSLYPYSGVVIASVLDALSDFETTKGSIHFSADHQLPDAIVRRIVEARRTEIDATARQAGDAPRLARSRTTQTEAAGNRDQPAVSSAERALSAQHYAQRMSRIFTTSFASVYPLYVTKVERKGRTKAELDQVIEWLTGFDESTLGDHLAAGTTFEGFFSVARLNPHASLIAGVVCGVRVEDVADPLMRKIRYLDKLVDELAKGKSMEKILRA